MGPFTSAGICREGGDVSIQWVPPSLQLFFLVEIEERHCPLTELTDFNRELNNLPLQRPLEP